jgi:hypothetical protein
MTALMESASLELKRDWLGMQAPRHAWSTWITALTEGMVEGIRRAGLHGVPVEKRSLQREKAENAA